MEVLNNVVAVALPRVFIAREEYLRITLVEIQKSWIDGRRRLLMEAWARVEASLVLFVVMLAESGGLHGNGRLKLRFPMFLAFT